MDYKKLITNRITDILNIIFNGNKSKFGDSIGLDESRIRSYTKDNIEERSMPSADFIALVIEKIDINPEWLLLGIGEMKKNISSQFELNNINIAENYSEYAIKSDLERELQELKEQNRDLIKTNLNLSDILKKKNTAEGA